MGETMEFVKESKMESKEEILMNIKLVRDQLKLAYQIREKSRRLRCVTGIQFWLEFLEDRYAVIVYCDTKDCS